MESLLQDGVVGSAYVNRRSEESVDRFVGRVLGNPRMVRTNLPADFNPAGNLDVYVGAIHPENPVQLVAVVPPGSADNTEDLQNLRWSTLHFVDPEHSRIMLRTQPSSVDLHAADAVVLKSLPGPWGPSGKSDRREYALPTEPSERGVKAVLNEAPSMEVPFGMSRLCDEVTLFTLAFSKSAWLERT